MKKVLIMASVSGMIEAFNQDNIALLLNKNYEVHVLANFYDPDNKRYKKNLIFKDKLEYQNIKVYDLPIQRDPFSRINIEVYKNVKHILNNERYSLIHCHTPVGGVLGRLASRETRKYGTQLIYTAHGFHFFEGAPIKNWLIYYSVEKLLSSSTDCLITINPEDYKIAKKKNFKIKNIELTNGVGVNLEKFKPATQKEKYRLRELNNFSLNDILLIYVGELSDRKNQIQAIKMMEKLIIKSPEAKLLIVGDGKNLNYYKEVIHTLNLTDHVILLGYRSDIPELMSLSDICISTSVQEGLPVNIMEAMATGLPLVVTDCRGNRDLVQNGVNGFIININDHEGMTEKVFNLIENKALRKTFGRRNEIFITPYEIRNVNPQMDIIYEKCFNNGLSSQLPLN